MVKFEEAFETSNLDDVEILYCLEFRIIKCEISDTGSKYLIADPCKQASICLHKIATGEMKISATLIGDASSFLGELIQ